MRISGNLLCSAFLLVQTAELNIVFSLFPLIVLKIMQLVVLSLRTHWLQSILIPGIEQTLWCWLCRCTWLVNTAVTTPFPSWFCSLMLLKPKSLCFWIFFVCLHWQLEHFLRVVTEHKKHWHRPFQLKMSYPYQGISCFLLLFVSSSSHKMSS